MPKKWRPAGALTVENAAAAAISRFETAQFSRNETRLATDAAPVFPAGGGSIAC
jgi:hypothetical protein